ncbi:MAG: lysine 2,3-aminomutase [Firmicutes bacterium]|nr:lysine 2,3-aminomutase [Bacillota bacterium]
MRDYHEVALWRGVTPEQWRDWHWQVAHRITTVQQLKEVIDLTPEEEEGVRTSLRHLRMAITPYFASLIDPQDPRCPIRRQSVPTQEELVQRPGEMADPLFEDTYSPVKGLTHRYPDRVLFLVTDQCGTYCRHCTRRRFAGETDRSLPGSQIDQALAYIRTHPEIRDVLVSGGDPLLLGDGPLEHILRQLREIPHVEIIRLGTRTPSTLPQRITPELLSMLRRYHPLWVNVQFNHPKELTPESKRALADLADAGIPLGNQSVLLKGINDCPEIMKELVHELVKARVRPYYLYQCDLVEGIGHFRTSVARGVQIMESLRGHTSGLAVPTFVIDAPGGGGKIPVGPQYLISMAEDRVVLRNFEGGLYAYTQPVEKGATCQDCYTCLRHGQTVGGVSRLLAGDTLKLTPEGLEQEKRRRTRRVRIVPAGEGELPGPSVAVGLRKSRRRG